MDGSAFILLAYQLPSNPSTHRSYVWRKLKAMGALYLQNSVCLLPAGGDREEALAALRDEILARGGGADLLGISVSDRKERASLVARFRAQSEDEYGEFLERCEGLLAELERERKRRHFTWGELEENEVDLVKLRSWLPRIAERDFTGSPSGARAGKVLAECEGELARFAAEVEAAGQGAGERSSGSGRAGGSRLLGSLRKRVKRG